MAPSVGILNRFRKVNSPFGLQNLVFDFRDRGDISLSTLLLARPHLQLPSWWPGVIPIFFCDKSPFLYSCSDLQVIATPEFSEMGLSAFPSNVPYFWIEWEIFLLIIWKMPTFAHHCQIKGSDNLKFLKWTQRQLAHGVPSPQWFNLILFLNFKRKGWYF